MQIDTYEAKFFAQRSACVHQEPSGVDIRLVVARSLRNIFDIRMIEPCFYDMHKLCRMLLSIGI